MTSYADPPISDAHRKAIEARAKFYADRPDELAKLPEKIRSAAPSLGDCLAHYEEADVWYSEAFFQWSKGHAEAGAAALDLAAHATAAGHSCIDEIIHENPFE